MKKISFLTIIITAFLMTYCTESSSDFESIEGIEFEMKEFSTSFFSEEDAPKELKLSISYEKEDTTKGEEDVFSMMDRHLSHSLDSSGLEYMIALIDTTMFQMQNFEEWEWYSIVKESGQKNFNGSGTTDGFGIHYEIELIDTVSNEVKVDYFIQFKAIFKKDIPKRRVLLKDGDKSLKAIRKTMVQALEEIERYEPKTSK